MFTQRDQARISTSDRKATVISKGIKQNCSGGKQLYDSGLKYDSGLYYDKWGNNPAQGEIAVIGGGTSKSEIYKNNDKANIRKD